MPIKDPAEKCDLWILIGATIVNIGSYDEGVHKLSYACCGWNLPAEEFSDGRYPEPTFGLPFDSCKVEGDEYGYTWRNRKSHPSFIGASIQIVGRIGHYITKAELHNMAPSKIRTASFV